MYYYLPLSGIWVTESNYLGMLSGELYGADQTKTWENEDTEHPREDFWDERGEFDFFDELKEKIQKYRDRASGIIRTPKSTKRDEWDGGRGLTGSNVDLFSMLSELLCSSGGIIQIPAGVTYTLEETIAVISYAATSTANSVEAAVSELKRKMPDAAIPSADTVFNYVYTNDIEDILSFFRRVNSEILALTGIPHEPVDVAVDFHDNVYHGDKNDKGVRGIKPKNGTSWGHSFFTIDMLWNPKLTLDIVNITGLNKDYAMLIEGVLTRIKRIGLKIRKIFLDREFFNLSSILTLFTMDVDFIMAAKSNKRINKLLVEHKRKNGVTPVVFKYQFKDKSCPEFYLVAIPNPDYAKDKNNGEFHLFATNIDFGSVEEFIRVVPDEYKRRWNIETGYRVKNEFKIKTCSKEAVARVLFFVVQSILHNFLNVQKSILSITAYELKSLIVTDIQNYLCEGTFANAVSLREFHTKMAGYNERRVTELRCQLAAA